LLKLGENGTVRGGLDGWSGSDSFFFLVTTAGLPIAASFLSMAFDIEKVGKLGESFSLVENEMG
jgi:hypothetical protein